MRNFVIITAVLLAGGQAFAEAPEYSLDPFGDGDFEEIPLILDTAFPTKARAEVSLLVASSMIDKYSSHTGLMLDVNYNIFETLGVGVTVGMLHGQLTNIVTDGAGIIGNKVAQLMIDPNKTDINPNVPDYNQLTGVVELMAIWTPLYGKINVVSEVDVNLQAYGLAGMGINGTRKVLATASAPQHSLDYQLTGQNFGDGGFLNDPKVNMTLGGGLRIFLADWVDLRAEIRGLLFTDEFDFNPNDADPEPQTYLSSYWFGHLGLGFILF
ncbi:outer membrane beta-barrel domain-containing protein [Myxococcota bacterium]|nr:outer membrane beta-barrel domain-containing protein [Myxococcota bacterium]